MLNKFAIIDLETTGSSPLKGDKIIQIAIVIVKDWEITERYTSFINPENPLPLFIKQFTGIDEEMLKNAPNFTETAPEINELLKNTCFVAHNVQFDLTFLNEQLQNAGFSKFKGPILDTVELARIVYPTNDSYKLTDLAKQFGKQHDRPHQADSDAEVTAELFIQMVKKLYNMPEQTLNSLAELSNNLKSDFKRLLETIILKKQHVSTSERSDLKIYNNIALKKFNFTETTQDNEPNRYPENNDEKQLLFKEHLPSYTYRYGQFEMMDLIYNNLLQNKHSIIEAGTGIGKSLAYLLPVAYFAKQTNNKIIISTYTTFLQQQLLHNEIVYLKKMLPFKINVALLKGRSNYLSLSKFSQSLNEIDDNYDVNLTKMQILIWLTETKTGDVDELNLSSGGASYWENIASNDLVALNKGVWENVDFYKRAKIEAENAHVIITNHALLLTDIELAESVLPKCDHIIIDEAHQFLNVAPKQIGARLNYVSARTLLSKLDNLMRGTLINNLVEISSQLKIKHNNFNKQLIDDSLAELSDEIDQFYMIIQSFIKKKIHQTGQTKKVSIRFNKNDPDASPVVYSAERYYFLLKDISNELINYFKIIKQGAEQLTSSDKFKVEQLAQVFETIEKTTLHLKQLFLTNSADIVTWIETDYRSPFQLTTIYGEPIQINNLLNKKFLTKKKSVIFTSATITINNSFRYFIDELGLNNLSYETGQYPSPFNYEQKVRLFIPEDIPEVNDVPMDDYVAALAETIITIAEVTMGRMLILFTSYEMLNKTYNLLKESGYLEEFAIFAQGVTSGSRTRLTRSFQKYERAILLGTNSFWDGLHIPGESLSCLLIVRLPFSPPTNPTYAAKRDLLSKQGKNPFTNLSLPEAILRFKQGFGRLIRTESDQGIVVVFDRRIVTKSYGKAFLKSIPNVPVNMMRLNEIVNQIDEFL